MKTEKLMMTREDFDLRLAELQGGENAEQPALLSINADLGNMPDEGSGWRNLLDAIEEASKYVDLNLSACTMNGSGFNPGTGIKTGKEKIVAIALPENAKSIGLNPVNEKHTFKHFSNLKTISGKGIESIWDYAFYDCKELASVGFPSVKDIGEDAFCNCENLVSEDFPEAETKGKSAFSGCENFVIANFPLANSIEEDTFNRCINLTRVGFPAAAKLSDFVFTNCQSLTEFVLLGDGCLSLIENGKALVRDNELVAYPSASGSVSLDKITNIIGGAFSYCENLVSVDFSLVVNIGEESFSYCNNLVSVNFPLVESIGNGAFFCCRRLSNVDFPSAISIGEDAFIECTGLVGVNFPLISNIGKSAFFGCKSIVREDIQKKVNIDSCTFEKNYEETFCDGTLISNGGLSTRKSMREFDLWMFSCIEEVMDKVKEGGEKC